MSVTNSAWLAIIGLLALIYITLRLIWIIWLILRAYLFAPCLNISSKYLEKGTWAVVTGATDGIGKAYAEELASKGMNIILISRSIDKLNDVAKYIGNNYTKVEVKTIVADFSKGYSIYDDIRRQLDTLDVSLLVNNVGASYENPEYLAETTDDDLDKLILVNCYSVTFMTKMVLNGMVNRKKGVIVNIASQSALFPVPLLTVYAATKAYVKHFTNGLEGEYADKGITFQCVSPGYVVSKLSKLKRASYFAPNPNTYVKSAVATIGTESNTAGYLGHYLMEIFILALPYWIMLPMITKMMKSIRAKALARNPKNE